MPSPTTPVPKGPLEAQLGEQFRSTRRRSRVWLRPLAAELGCSVNTIRWHENGARMMRADLLARAAEIMGVAPGVLMSISADEQSESREQSNEQPENT